MDFHAGTLRARVIYLIRLYRKTPDRSKILFGTYAWSSYRFDDDSQIRGYVERGMAKETSECVCVYTCVFYMCVHVVLPGLIHLVRSSKIQMLKDILAALEAPAANPVEASTEDGSQEASVEASTEDGGQQAMVEASAEDGGQQAMVEDSAEDGQQAMVEDSTENGDQQAMVEDPTDQGGQQGMEDLGKDGVKQQMEARMC